MECMCVQTRVRFILNEKSFRGMESETHVNSKGKLPSTGGSKEGRTRNTASRGTASPAHNPATDEGPPRWPRERKIPGSNPACAGIFPGRVIPVTSKLELQWLPFLAPGVIGSVLGLVGPVSVYCNWVRWKVGSATSISVWQNVNLSEQIRP